VSTEGVGYLREALQHTTPQLTDIELWMRVNLKDYELGLSDYVTLAALLDEVVARAPHLNVSIWCSDSLHAKCFVTDLGALLGSCNLSRSGLEGNVELAIRLEPEEISRQIAIREVLRSSLQSLGKAEWESFVGDLAKASRPPSAGVPANVEGSWESFVQGLLAQGPPYPGTPLR